MDVNETLRALRDAVRDWHRFDDPMDALNAADKVIESFESLDEWLSKGGFLPFDWGMAGPGSITRMPEGTVVPTEG